MCSRVIKNLKNIFIIIIFYIKYKLMLKYWAGIKICCYLYLHIMNINICCYFIYMVHTTQVSIFKLYLNHLFVIQHIIFYWYLL